MAEEQRDLKSLINQQLKTKEVKGKRAVITRQGIRKIIDALLETYGALDKKDLIAKMTEMELASQSARNKADSLKQQLSELIKEHEALKQRLAEAEAALQAAAQREQELAGQLAAQQEANQKTAAGKEHDLRALREEYDRKMAELQQQMQQAIANLQQQLQQAQASKDQALAEQKAQYEQQLQQLQQQLAAGSQGMQQALADKDRQLQEREAQLQAHIQEMQRKMQELAAQHENERRQYMSDMDAYKGQTVAFLDNEKMRMIQELKSNVDRAQQDADGRWEQRCDELAQLARTAEAREHALNKRIAELEKALADREAEKSELGRQIDGLNGKLSAHGLKRSEAIDRIHELEDQLRKLRDELARKEKLLGERIRYLTTELKYAELIEEPELTELQTGCEKVFAGISDLVAGRDDDELPENLRHLRLEADWLDKRAREALHDYPVLLNAMNERKGTIEVVSRLGRLAALGETYEKLRTNLLRLNSAGKSLPEDSPDYLLAKPKPRPKPAAEEPSLSVSEPPPVTGSFLSPTPSALFPDSMRQEVAAARAAPSSGSAVLAPPPGPLPGPPGLAGPAGPAAQAAPAPRAAPAPAPAAPAPAHPSAPQAGWGPPPPAAARHNPAPVQPSAPQAGWGPPPAAPAPSASSVHPAAPAPAPGYAKPAAQPSYAPPPSHAAPPPAGSFVHPPAPAPAGSFVQPPPPAAGFGAPPPAGYMQPAPPVAAPPGAARPPGVVPPPSSRVYEQPPPDDSKTLIQSSPVFDASDGTQRLDENDLDALADD